MNLEMTKSLIRSVWHRAVHIHVYFSWRTFGDCDGFSSVYPIFPMILESTVI